MRALFLLPCLGLVLTGCKNESGFTPDPPVTPPPEDTGDTVIEEILSDTPIAVCEVNKNPVQPPFETARFDGAASYDPNDLAIIGYEWALVAAPDGNGAALSTRTGPQTNLTPQLAGTYIVELNVINELGLRSEEPCTIALEATPDEDLWVELFWSHSGEDMDLHLLRPGGSLETEGDCYYANCAGGGFFGGVDWGTQGVVEDDPVLDLDDIPGVGPENINLEDPQAGDFTVVVHDYPGSSRMDATNVTINVYLGGEQVFSEQRSISGEDTYTNYVRVNPTTGAVTPL